MSAGSTPKIAAIVSAAAALILSASILSRSTSALAQSAVAPAATAPAFTIDFSNPGLSPAHWTLTFAPDGSGHFKSEAAVAPSGRSGVLGMPALSRDIHLTPAFASSVFAAAARHNWFNQDCESHMKVAFQGTKKLSYIGPQGSGTCTFNYSKDKEIQSLGDSLTAVSATIIEGAKLEMLLQHDPLGLDQEMEVLTNAAHDGRAQQLCTISDILQRLAQDDRVMDMVRKQARLLLAGASS